MKNVNIITLGCSKNTVDSENIAGHLAKFGFNVGFDKNSTADYVIINTCGFIGDAKEESINVILEQAEIKKHRRKKNKLIVCGCLSERYRNELLNEIPEIDNIYGVHEWNKLIDDITEEISQAFDNERITSTPKHYAYIKISEGCNRSCSYCAIPLIRGKHISRPIEKIVDEAKVLVNQGVKEIILIAQDTTFYGLDLYGKQCLGTLMEELANKSGAKWIRLHYTFPTSFPDDVIEVMKKHENICKYIDIPLQHIDTNILKSMNRGIDEFGTKKLLEKFRAAIPNVAVRTSLIVGYPGETEEQFQLLVDFVKEQRFDRLGVFRYSPEEGTPSFALADDISPEEKEHRYDELMAVQETISLEKNQEKIGQQFKVLIDSKEGDFWVGRTEYDSPEVDNEVLVKSTKRLRIGNFYTVSITDANEYDLIGELCN